ncbi:M20/M25/M40 family metallo-hydrolase [Mycolicibacterium novocastrense]|nr:M20/M25/M40 family metallo-hydrolase [Mycolicibacterium novocastrense]
MTDEFFAAHMCGCGHALISDSPKKTDPAAARSVSRRQVIGAAGVLTAAALLAACGSRDGSDQGAGTSEAPAPSVNPSVSPAELGNVMNGIDEVQVWQEEFYKDLHRHPDVWGEEARTAGKVTDKLQEVGVEEILQIGGGVVGVIRNGEGRSVLFRADMDALPVTEATGLEYASTEPGKMHACGHDAHVASALGAAALLAKNRNAWSGTYLALFQPGEETGAKARRRWSTTGLSTSSPTSNPTCAWASTS